MFQVIRLSYQCAVQCQHSYCYNMIWLHDLQRCSTEAEVVGNFNHIIDAFRCYLTYFVIMGKIAISTCRHLWQKRQKWQTPYSKVTASPIFCRFCCWWHQVPYLMQKWQTPNSKNYLTAKFCFNFFYVFGGAGHSSNTFWRKLRQNLNFRFLDIFAIKEA